MHFSERDIPKELIKYKVHQDQMKNKVYMYKTETSIFAPQGLLFGNG
jgi:hypothetical protein